MIDSNCQVVLEAISQIAWQVTCRHWIMQLDVFNPSEETCRSRGFRPGRAEVFCKGLQAVGSNFKLSWPFKQPQAISVTFWYIIWCKIWIPWRWCALRAAKRHGHLDDDFTLDPAFKPKNVLHVDILSILSLHYNIMFNSYFKCD